MPIDPRDNHQDVHWSLAYRNKNWQQPKYLLIGEGINEPRISTRRVELLHQLGKGKAWRLHQDTNSPRMADKDSKKWPSTEGPVLTFAYQETPRQMCALQEEGRENKGGGEGTRISQ